MDLFLELYARKISAANAGDVDASKWLIKEFLGTIKNNRDEFGKPLAKPSGIHTQFHEPLLDYFAARFSELLDGVPADVAMGLSTGSAGRGKLKNKHERDTTLVIAVLHELAAAPGISKEEAKKRAARKLKTGKATIDKAWNNHAAQLNAELITRLSSKY